MFNRKVITSIVALGFVSGCVPIYPEVDQHYGEAVRAAKRAQTLNPEGSPIPKQAHGIDGMAADGTMERYVNSFKEPPPAVNVINIGGPLASPQAR